MKMKEKKEEVVEEVVNNELLDYLEFARQCYYQLDYFNKEVFHKVSNAKELDELATMLGLDISKPIKVLMGYDKKDILKEFDNMLSAWILTFNELNLDNFDNYTQKIISYYFVPCPCTVKSVKKKLKECDSQSTEK